MPEQTIIPPDGSPPHILGEPDYASFTSRLIALAIDRLFLSVLLFVIFIPLGLVSFVGALFVMPQLSFVQGVVSPSLWVLVATLDWVYFAVMESGARGATFGKRIMGVRVQTDKGERLTFARASLRYFMKIISALPMMLGFVMAIFTAKKQALHDFFAETLVVKA